MQNTTYGPPGMGGQQQQMGGPLQNQPLGPPPTQGQYGGANNAQYGAPPMGAPPMGGPPMGGPPQEGGNYYGNVQQQTPTSPPSGNYPGTPGVPPMGNPSMGSPAMGGPPMGGPPTGVPSQMGGVPQMGPPPGQMGGPPQNQPLGPPPTQGQYGGNAQQPPAMGPPPGMQQGGNQYSTAPPPPQGGYAVGGPPQGGGYQAQQQQPPTGGYQVQQPQQPVGGGYSQLPPPPSNNAMGGGYGQPAPPQTGYSQMAPPPMDGTYQQPTQYGQASPQVPPPQPPSPGGQFGAPPSPSSYGQGAYPAMAAAPSQQAPPQPMQYISLNLRRPAIGPNAGQVLGSEEFPRLQLEDYKDSEPNIYTPPHPADLKPCPAVFMRCSYGSVPNSNVITNALGIPFGAVIQPMARLDTAIPLVNFAQVGSNIGVVRCRRCRTYINPYVRWVENGRKWICNVCTSANDVPQEYFSPLEGNGLRRDMMTRPELLHPTCEFIAPPEYMVRPPQRPSYVFVIDVSQTAVASGFLQGTCQSILSCLNEFPGGERSQVAIVTFDSTVHFYNLRAKQAKMMISPELVSRGCTKENLEDVVLPLPDGLLISVADCKDVLQSLLEKIPQMFANNTNVETAFGPALLGAMKLLMGVGGKMITFLSCMPSIGQGRLSNRDDKRLYGTPKERELFVGASDWYRDQSLLCSREQICVDMFLKSSQYIDVATLGQLAKYTGGEINYSRGFYPDKGDVVKLQKEVSRIIFRETGFEAVMRIRCSAGVKITHFFGHFFVRGADLLALPNIDEDKGFAIMMEHMPNQIISTPTFYIQAALLYTTVDGQRRIRVHTLQLPVTSSAVEVYRHLDCLSATELIAKKAVDTALSQSLETARGSLFELAVNVMKHYRQLLAQNQRADQSLLIIPESLRLLPLMLMCLIKYTTFRYDTEIHSDDRVSGMGRLMTTSISKSLRFIHPQLFDVVKILRQEEDILVQPTSKLSLSSGGVYLLDTGLYLAVWVGRSVDPNILQTLFSTTDPNAIQAVANSDAVQPIIQFITQKQEQGISACWPNVVLVKEGSPLEKITFLKWLVEDEATNVHNYGNFLAHLHKRVST